MNLVRERAAVARSATNNKVVTCQNAVVLGRTRVILHACMNSSLSFLLSKAYPHTHLLYPFVTDIFPFIHQMSSVDTKTVLHRKKRILIAATGSVASVKIPIIVKTLIEVQDLRR